MKFHWTSETAFTGYTLRDSRGYARAVITTPGSWKGFYGQVFARDMPASGPYKSRQEAADFVTGLLVKLSLVPADSEFGDLPEIPKDKRVAA